MFDTARMILRTSAAARSAAFFLFALPRQKAVSLVCPDAELGERAPRSTPPPGLPHLQGACLYRHPPRSADKTATQRGG
eukprot:500036-Prorocentrum_minimum.AAC.1